MNMNKFQALWERCMGSDIYRNKLGRWTKEKRIRICSTSRS